jgi:hypothetical protein
LWLNPQNENTFPPGLIDALTLHSDLLLGVIKPLRQGDPTFSAGPDGRVASEAQRLRLQMQVDALQPLHNVDEDDDDGSGKARSSAVSGVDRYTPEILEEATQFLRLQVCGVISFSVGFAFSSPSSLWGRTMGKSFLMFGLCVKLIRRYIFTFLFFPQAQDRLQLVLSYLRDRYAYCFWCGIRYDSEEDMANECPGPGEDDHD